MSETTTYKGPYAPMETQRNMERSALMEKVLMHRECSRVKRFHTWTIIGEQTVGQHSFDMLTLLLLIHPSASRNLILAVIFHDFPERWLGDLPAPARWVNADLAAEYAKTEEMVLSQKNIQQMHLTEEEDRWLQIVDKLELWCWCQDQVSMGNTRVGLMMGVAAGWLRKQEWMPGIVMEFMSNFSHHRTPES